MTQPNPRPVTCTAHEPVWCDSPGCPGARVKRQLEMFEELLAALEGWLAVVDEHGRGNCCGCNYEEQADLTRAAIAKASPQAR